MTICVHCGKLIQGKEIKGSFKHPYCINCFKIVWEDDDEKYLEWLTKEHNKI